MSIVYLLKNQHNHYLDKSGEWVSGEHQKTLYRTAHKDEAINQKVEFSVKNFELRISIFEVSLDDRGNIAFQPEDIELLTPLETESAEADMFDEAHSAQSDNTISPSVEEESRMQAHI